MVLFLIMARLLTAPDFGLVAAAGVVLAFLEVLHEQGLGDALVQRPILRQEDLNAAFWTSLSVSLVTTSCVLAGAGAVASWLGMPEVRPLLRVASLALPISAAGVCQQALCRRAFDYRWLAVRTVVATSVSGLLGIACALRGLGAWSLVVQGLSAALLNTLVLWSRPLFRPTLSLDGSALRRLLAYSSHILGNRLVDFGITRIVDLLVALQAGPAALGVYTVGARVYQTLMASLSAVVLDVAHGGFSRLAPDREALRRAYYGAVELTAAVAAPCFVLLAALSRDVTAVLFGGRWAEAAPVMHALCWLGALQCIQFYNGTCFNAVGRPSLSLLLNALKLAAATSALLLLPTRTVGDFARTYALAVAAVAPVSFALAARVLGVSPWRVARTIWPFAAAALGAYAAVRLRPLAWEWGADAAPWVRLAGDGFLGAGLYAVLCLSLVPARCGALLRAMLEWRHGRLERGAPRSSAAK